MAANLLILQKPFLAAWQTMSAGTYLTLYFAPIGPPVLVSIP